jgi:hypothetical protein
MPAAKSPNPRQIRAAHLRGILRTQAATSQAASFRITRILQMPFGWLVRKVVLFVSSRCDPVRRRHRALLVLSNSYEIGNMNVK